MSFRSAIAVAARRTPFALQQRVAPRAPIVASTINRGVFRRFASTEPGAGPQTDAKQGGGGGSALLFVVLAAAGAGGYYYYSTLDDKAQTKVSAAALNKPLNYQEVYNEVAKLVDSNPDYDDGSYGPVLIRLAWHAAGTYDQHSNTGGSNGATMRFPKEGAHGANAGLKVARDLLEPVKGKFPQISYSDLWSIGGVVGVQELGGPKIKWRPGRVDNTEDFTTPDGRLPDASRTQDHIRDVFYRMGFNDQEIVALAGAHALGRCHADRSGFDGPWTRSPTTFSNDYFKRLLEEKWVERKWKGPKQFADKATGDLMMLPADLAFVKDRAFKKYVDLYAKDDQKFYDDFALAFQKLEELGVPFKGTEPVIVFKTLDEQSA
ncbi:heme peroxidase [Rhizophlyctis rosea]|uniref:Peroxidase n=1 Tax=Rhizophlyctis rosea TaxID=64517 RepID=A0AAD5SJ46_9FUNG|nr:heme peroxidase [Rhizophlyctis rosea]